jgi:hypothetical protein
VLWSVNNFTLAEDLTPKFMSKENGASVPIVDQVFKARDQSASDIHVSSLNPFKVDTMWPNHNHVNRPSPDLVGHLEYEVRGHLQV